MGNNEVFCEIIPPHLLEEIAKRGKAHQRERARRALTVSAQFRRRRRAVIPKAPSGAHRLAVGQIEKLKFREIYDAGHRERLPGRMVRSEGDRRIKDVAVNEAYDYSGRTYDFFQRVFGRNSLDGRGLSLKSSVHYGAHYDNAFWNGAQMVYGDGDGEFFERFTAALDVVGHELTHGVVQFEAGLAYWGQPGALNESFADVFGSLVKQFVVKQKAKDADWLVGRGLLTSKIRGKALRSLKDPGTAYDDPLLGKDPQPGHMKDYVAIKKDNGGVHINSGIPNKAFYETAIRLGGYAWEKAGRIWYAALTEKLSEEADFAQAAKATTAAAAELYGVKSREWQATKDGWEAVGVKFDSGDGRQGHRGIKIRLSRAGGFAGIERIWELDEKTLRPGKIKELKKIVTKARLFASASVSSRRSQVRDAFEYQLTIEDKDQKQTVQCAETTAPQALRRCFDWIQKNSLA
ncbi:MAG: M4 family metallopeptidase [Elusimicrobia bacterium]|nr:M4 family metallopeptidase [Elusimicrobiota bacterium]